MTSMPSSVSASAMRIFSVRFIEKPGDCSPSRNVVSKKMMRSSSSLPKLDDDRIIFFDTTLRDGEQSPGFSMNLTEKIRMAEALTELGIDVMEAGFPIASPGDYESVNEIAKTI